MPDYLLEFLDKKRVRQILVSVAAFFVFFIGVYLYFMRGLPEIDILKHYQPNVVTKVFSKDGDLIGEFYVERRVVVPIDSMPEHLVKAFIAAEDAQFFEHEGVSYISIIRAFYKNLTAGKIVQGGSTITQQVARSFFLTPEKKVSRKIKEIIMAYRIESNLDKEEILNLYLNQIYLGNGAYGVQAAAQTYFGKDVSELTVAESALLAGLPKAPSKYSPYADEKLAKQRQEYVLSRMVEEGFISAETEAEALGEGFVLAPDEEKSLWVGSYFTEHVRRHLEEKYGWDLLYRGGLNIYTTLDVKLQKAANEAVDRGLRDFDKRRGYRGPVRVLSTAEEVDAFREEIDRKLERRPLEPDDVILGVITAVDKKLKTLRVDVGSRQGVIKDRELRWARTYNPEGESDGKRVEDPIRLFNTGDVIEVRVRDVPLEPASPLSLALEQAPQAEAALLAMEPETGYVRAMVGGSGFSKTQFNRAVQALRQPGSAFKPIIYSAALDGNYTPATVVMDTPLVFDGEISEAKWRPRNYDERFGGPTTVRKAIAKSRNVVTIKVLKDIGVAKAVDNARRLGITSPLAKDLSLALGSSAVTLQEMTTAFATFANLGRRPEPLFITYVTDKDGNVLEENDPLLTEALSPETSFVMTKMLEGVIESGTAMRARSLGRPAAGKTGTTNNLNDAWFLGYVPGLVAGSWIGYDEERELGERETGSRAALPIWLDFMKKATADMPVRNFDVPDGVEFARIDPETGLLAGPYTEEAIFEVFKSGTAPTEVSTRQAKAGAADFFTMDTDAGDRPVDGVEKTRKKPLFRIFSE